MAETQNFFVYGTLKMGGRFAEMYADHFDPNRKSVCEASIKGKLFDLGFFPGVKLDKGDGEVHGELHVFKNPEAIQDIFDRIEGYNSENPKKGLFDRVEVEVSLENGSTETATIYVFNGDPSDSDEIESGVWDIHG